MPDSEVVSVNKDLLKALIDNSSEIIVITNGRGHKLTNQNFTGQNGAIHDYEDYDGVNTGTQQYFYSSAYYS